MCRIAERLLADAYSAARPGGRPGLILFVQTFGDLVTFNPHIHVLAADGVFRADGVFVRAPAVPSKLLELGFRSQVLDLLLAEAAISDELAASIRGWHHTGFSVHNAVRVRGDDSEGRKKLAQYMLHAPFSLDKMSYDANTGMVIYRSHMHKSLKRNYQLMPGAQWLEMLCRHIPDRFEHLVRYAGWYSNRVRGRRSAAPQPAGEEPEDAQAVAIRARSTWARLIHKVYEVDPLLCPRCNGPMHVIALIEDADVIRRILEHLGRWNPRPVGLGTQRSPPTQGAGDKLAQPAQNVLTYHPVPDIA